MQTKLLYSMIEAAEALAASRSNTCELMAAGRLESVKLGAPRRSSRKRSKDREVMVAALDLPTRWMILTTNYYSVGITP